MDSPGSGARGAASLAAFASSCTLHGLGHVFVPGAPAPRRLLWAGAFLASLGAFLLQAGERVRHYAAYPHVTMLDEAESRVLVFPAVTLCNYNRIRRSQLTPNDLFWLGKELLAVEREDFSRYLRALGQPADFTGFFPSKSYDLAAFYQRAGHPIHDMLLSCRFRGQDCGPENFTAVSATATTVATAVATAPTVAVAGSAAGSSALGRTRSSPHPLPHPLPHPHARPALPPGWLCPGQGLGRTQGRAG
uniref:Acid sensing ion channel subunit 3 n=1 Tax=Anser brachyrhynchus TaxID=132585 RepID=A0A8B9CJ75_9AVES